MMPSLSLLFWLFHCLYLLSFAQAATKLRCVCFKRHREIFELATVGSKRAARIKALKSSCVNFEKKKKNSPGTHAPFFLRTFFNSMSDFVDLVEDMYFLNNKYILFFDCG